VFIVIFVKTTNKDFINITMIRHFFLILFFSSFAIYGQNSAKASKESLKLKEEIFQIIKENALYTDSLDWKKIKDEYETVALSENDSVSQSILFKFFTEKLRQAGDHHSFFVSKKTMTAKKQITNHEQPKGMYLGDHIGLIKVPRCVTFDAEKDLAFANTIWEEIKNIDSTNDITGWIVDLRHNSGGNMWPMLAGLNALIEDGEEGYFVYPASNYKMPWLSENGSMLSQKSKINDYKIKDRQLKIAVLIDSLTASSGEMTAISFLGLPNVKTFGQPSAGYTTSNGTFPLSNGSHLYLATSHAADRTGKVYKEKIFPDVTVEDNSNTKEDEVIQEAKKWIRQ